MRSYLQGRRLALVVGVAGVVMAVGGVAYASIPDGSDAIHGCYSANGANATNGTPLNIIDSASASCKGGQSAISWNAIGPAGPAGPKGDAGPAGPAGTNGTNGANGASAGLFDHNPDTVDLPVGSDVTVATMSNIPAGSYIFTARVQVDNGSNLTVFFLCHLRAPGGAFDDAGQEILPTGGDAAMNLPLMLSDTFTSTGTATITCNANNVEASATNASISAIQVQSLTQTTG